MTQTRSLSVHYLPQFVAESEMAGGAVVVIDLLRASTTICWALASGATEVCPYVEVGDVVREAELEPDRDDLVLGGERGGEIIPGFDLGNSPAEYTPAEVFGKRVLFTTTNGTRALEHARLAQRVLVGSIANLSAVAQSLLDEEHVHLLCAGTGGHVTREDQLAAGAIVHEVLRQDGPGRALSQSADAVLGEWRELLATARAAGRTADEQLAQDLRDTPGGKNLLAVGMADDLPRCAEIDALNILPVYDPKTRRITAQ